MEMPVLQEPENEEFQNFNLRYRIPKKNNTENEICKIDIEQEELSKTVNKMENIKTECERSTDNKKYWSAEPFKNEPHRNERGKYSRENIKNDEKSKSFTDHSVVPSEASDNFSKHIEENMYYRDEVPALIKELENRIFKDCSRPGEKFDYRNKNKESMSFRALPDEQINHQCNYDKFRSKSSSRYKHNSPDKLEDLQYKTSSLKLEEKDKRPEDNRKSPIPTFERNTRESKSNVSSNYEKHVKNRSESSSRYKCASVDSNGTLTRPTFVKEDLRNRICTARSEDKGIKQKDNKTDYSSTSKEKTHIHSSRRRSRSKSPEKEINRKYDRRRSRSKSRKNEDIHSPRSRKSRSDDKANKPNYNERYSRSTFRQVENINTPNRNRSKSTDKRICEKECDIPRGKNAQTDEIYKSRSKVEELKDSRKDGLKNLNWDKDPDEKYPTSTCRGKGAERKLNKYLEMSYSNNKDTKNRSSLKERYFWKSSDTERHRKNHMGNIMKNERTLAHFHRGRSKSSSLEEDKKGRGIYEADSVTKGYISVTKGYIHEHVTNYKRNTNGRRSRSKERSSDLNCRRLQSTGRYSKRRDFVRLRERLLKHSMERETQALRSVNSSEVEKSPAEDSQANQNKKTCHDNETDQSDLDDLQLFLSGDSDLESLHSKAKRDEYLRSDDEFELLKDLGLNPKHMTDEQLEGLLEKRKEKLYDKIQNRANITNDFREDPSDSDMEENCIAHFCDTGGELTETEESDPRQIHKFTNGNDFCYSHNNVGRLSYDMSSGDFKHNLAECKKEQFGLPSSNVCTLSRVKKSEFAENSSIINQNKTKENKGRPEDQVNITEIEKVCKNHDQLEEERSALDVQKMCSIFGSKESDMTKCEQTLKSVESKTTANNKNGTGLTKETLDDTQEQNYVNDLCSYKSMLERLKKINQGCSNFHHFKPNKSKENSIKNISPNENATNITNENKKEQVFRVSSSDLRQVEEKDETMVQYELKKSNDVKKEVDLIANKIIEKITFSTYKSRRKSSDGISQKTDVKAMQTQTHQKGIITSTKINTNDEVNGEYNESNVKIVPNLEGNVKENNKDYNVTDIFKQVDDKLEHSLLSHVETKTPTPECSDIQSNQENVKSEKDSCRERDSFLHDLSISDDDDFPSQNDPKFEKQDFTEKCSKDIKILSNISFWSQSYAPPHKNSLIQMLEDGLKEADIDSKNRENKRSLLPGFDCLEEIPGAVTNTVQDTLVHNRKGTAEGRTKISEGTSKETDIDLKNRKNKISPLAGSDCLKEIEEAVTNTIQDTPVHNRKGTAEDKTQISENVSKEAEIDSDNRKNKKSLSVGSDCLKEIDEAIINTIQDTPVPNWKGAAEGMTQMSENVSREADIDLENRQNKRSPLAGSACLKKIEEAVTNTIQSTPVHYRKSTNSGNMKSPVSLLSNSECIEEIQEAVTNMIQNTPMNSRSNNISDLSAIKLNTDDLQKCLEGDLKKPKEIKLATSSSIEKTDKRKKISETHRKHQKNIKPITPPPEEKTKNSRLLDDINRLFGSMTPSPLKPFELNFEGKAKEIEKAKRNLTKEVKISKKGAIDTSYGDNCYTKYSKEHKQKPSSCKKLKVKASVKDKRGKGDNEKEKQARIQKQETQPQGKEMPKKSENQHTEQKENQIDLPTFCNNPSYIPNFQDNQKIIFESPDRYIQRKNKDTIAKAMFSFEEPGSDNNVEEANNMQEKNVFVELQSREPESVDNKYLSKKETGENLLINNDIGSSAGKVEFLKSSKSNEKDQTHVQKAKVEQVNKKGKIKNMKDYLGISIKAKPKTKSKIKSIPIDSKKKKNPSFKIKLSISKRRQNETSSSAINKEESTDSSNDGLNSSRSDAKKDLSNDTNQKETKQEMFSESVCGKNPHLKKKTKKLNGTFDTKNRKRNCQKEINQRQICGVTSEEQKGDYYESNIINKNSEIRADTKISNSNSHCENNSVNSEENSPKMLSKDSKRNRRKRIYNEETSMPNSLSTKTTNEQTQKHIKTIKRITPKRIGDSSSIKKKEPMFDDNNAKRELFTENPISEMGSIKRKRSSSCSEEYGTEKLPKITFTEPTKNLKIDVTSNATFTSIKPQEIYSVIDMAPNKSSLPRMEQIYETFSKNNASSNGGNGSPCKLPLIDSLNPQLQPTHKGVFPDISINAVDSASRDAHLQTGDSTFPEIPEINLDTKDIHLLGQMDRDIYFNIADYSISDKSMLLLGGGNKTRNDKDSGDECNKIRNDMKDQLSFSNFLTKNKNTSTPIKNNALLMEGEAKYSPLNNVNVRKHDHIQDKNDNAGSDLPNKNTQENTNNILKNTLALTYSMSTTNINSLSHKTSETTSSVSKNCSHISKVARNYTRFIGPLKRDKRRPIGMKVID